MTTATCTTTPVTSTVLPAAPGAAQELAERVVAVLALVLLLPLLLVLAAAVRCTSPGPALFRQERVGLGGARFRLLKLRTMVDGAEALRPHLDNELDGVLFKVRQDPRVTPLGRVLRRWSLDELPQLVNVARGHMRLVGPRPALPEEVARYDALACRRLEVKPGLTGAWQVSGRSHLSWSESVRIDVAYVESRCLALDLRILARTVVAVLRRTGAY